ncbi:MAG: hypothetical protein QW493_04520 [Candidatus Bathyarchaeia archaeon]
MSEKESKIDREWVNEVFLDLLKVIYDGFGGASKFRCYLVGRQMLEYLTKKFNLNFSNLTIPEAAKKVLESLKMIGVIGGSDVTLSDMVIDFKIHDCAHLKVQERIKESKMPAFVCPCANICLGLLERNFGMDSEMIEITQEGNTCHVKAMLFKY